MADINFWTPIHFDVPNKTWTQQCGQFADDYFHRGDHIYLVDSRGLATKQNCPFEMSCAKVISAFTLVIPLLLLIAKALLRSFQPEYSIAIEEPVPSVARPAPEQPTPAIQSNPITEPVSTPAPQVKTVQEQIKEIHEQLGVNLEGLGVDEVHQKIFQDSIKDARKKLEVDLDTFGMDMDKELFFELLDVPEDLRQFVPKNYTRRMAAHLVLELLNEGLTILEKEGANAPHQKLCVAFATHPGTRKLAILYYLHEAPKKVLLQTTHMMPFLNALVDRGVIFKYYNSIKIKNEPIYWFVEL